MQIKKQQLTNIQNLQMFNRRTQEKYFLSFLKYNNDFHY